MQQPRTIYGMHHSCSCHANVMHIVEPPVRRVSSGRRAATTTQVLLLPLIIRSAGAEPPPPGSVRTIIWRGERRARVANRVELAVVMREEGRGMPTHCTCRVHAMHMPCTCHAHTMPCHMPCHAVSMSVSMFVSMFRALHGMCRAPWLVAARHPDHKRRAADVVHLRREGKHLLHIPLHVSSPWCAKCTYTPYAYTICIYCTRAYHDTLRGALPDSPCASHRRSGSLPRRGSSPSQPPGGGDNQVTIHRGL